jgi:hypothetical protein
MTGLLAFDADEHLASVAPLAISKGVRIFLPYYKMFSIADRDAIFAAGAAAGVQVGIIPIFEQGAQQALGGAAQGTTDGARIVQYMKAVGQPPGTSYILTFDFDEQQAQDQAIYAYAKACVASVPSNPMIAYGNGAAMEMLKSMGVAKFAWDAGGMGMRGTRADVTAGKPDMVQDVGDVRGLHLGIDIDSDFAPHASSPADLNAWMAGSVVVPAPAPPPIKVVTDPIEAILGAAAVGNFTMAVEAFQSANGLTADGVIGPNTLRKLWGR